MSLVESVQKLVGRPLTQDEVLSLANFQKEHEVDDGDPLMVVLGLVGAHRLMTEQLPTKLQESTKAVIELHAQTLREQAGLIAKELIVTLSQNIETAAHAQRSRTDRLLWNVMIFSAGVATALAVPAVFNFVLRLMKIGGGV